MSTFLIVAAFTLKPLQCSECKFHPTFFQWQILMECNESDSLWSLFKCEILIQSDDQICSRESYSYTESDVLFWIKCLDHKICLLYSFSLIATFKCSIMDDAVTLKPVQSLALMTLLPAFIVFLANLMEYYVWYCQSRSHHAEAVQCFVWVPQSTIYFSASCTECNGLAFSHTRARRYSAYIPRACPLVISSGSLSLLQRTLTECCKPMPFHASSSHTENGAGSCISVLELHLISLSAMIWSPVEISLMCGPFLGWRTFILRFCMTDSLWEFLVANSAWQQWVSTLLCQWQTHWR